MPPQKPVEIVAVEPFPSVYANSSRLMFSIYDFRLVFSETMMKGDFRVVQVDRVSVVMSPQHIKKLVSIVTKKLAEYEQKHGPIPDAPDADVIPEIENDDASREENASPEIE